MIANYLVTDDCVFYAIVEDKLIQVAAIGQKLNKDKSIKKALKIEIGEGIVGAVALSKKGIIIKDTRKNKNYIIDDQIRLSEITVPIILDGKLIGWMKEKDGPKIVDVLRKTKIMEKLDFKEKGTYTFKVTQNMPEDPLNYAMELGLILDKSK
jgi:hypothetical protein